MNATWQPLLRVEKGTAFGDLSVFRFRIGASAAMESWVGALDALEQARYRAFKSPDAAAQFLISRVVARTLLGHCLGIDARSVRLQQTANGKPFLSDDSLQLSISHTRGWGMVALSRSHAVGVDVEQHRELPGLEGIGRRFFSEAEAARVLGEAATAGQRAAFYRIWTLKEACVKSVGEGFNTNSSAFTTRSAVDARYARVESHGGTVPWGECRTRELPMPEGWSAAIALHTRNDGAPEMPLPEPACYHLDAEAFLS